MLSEIDVITIGASSVPLASILAPLAIISVEASAPVPAEALIIVPAGIVSVTPATTDTRPFKSYILEASSVRLEVIFPSKVESEY